MKKKTPDELADILDERYGDKSIGNELTQVLADVVKAGGYVNPAEIISAKKEVTRILHMLRLRRAS